MRALRIQLLLVANLFLTGAYAQSLSDMTPPSIDNPSEEWCFLAKSTTVIGMPYQPDVTQVTYDGSLLTGDQELSVYYGPHLRPMMARQKTFLEGWIPVVEYEWKDGSIDYRFEAFAQSLPGEDPSNTVNFVSVTAMNTGHEPSPAYVRFAFRAKPGAGVSSWQDHSARLTAGEKTRFTISMPRVRPSPSDSPFSAKLKAANYDVERDRTISFWRQAVEGTTAFRIPERRVQNALRASLVHMMLATRTRGGKRFQTDGLPYPDLFLTSNVQAEMAYDFLSRPQDYEASLPEILRRQSPDGIFMDTSMPQDGNPLIAAQGQTLHALSYHAVVNHDLAFGRRVFPAVAKGIGWMEAVQAKDDYGLMPPSWPYDNEMIRGRYTSHNLWCLLGLRSAIRLAKLLGEKEQAAEWSVFEARYSAAVVKALHASKLSDGSVPPGLHAYLTGNAARQGFKEYQTNQDWENMLLAAPTEVLAPNDPLITATLKRLHATKFREGVMTYRNGQHLHQYITANVMEQEMARGDQEAALTDLYHLLLHDGSTSEGFENLVQPWTRQVDPSCPPPHAWASMKTALVIRNALLVERGGRAGMIPAARELHLFSLLSPAWVRPGFEVGFRNALCEMGRLSASLKFVNGGADLRLTPHWRVPPKSIVFRLPWFLKLIRSHANGPISVSGDLMELGPTVTHVRIKWQVHTKAFEGTLQKLLLAYRREPDFKLVNGEGVVGPGREGALTAAERALPAQPLSFMAVKTAYGLEYERRFKAYIAAGGKPVDVSLPNFKS